MKINSYDSVWDAIENTPEEAENMRIRSNLMIEISNYIKRKNMTQAEAARKFGVTQPRISDLMRGKISLFGIDMLITMASRAGMQVEIQLMEAA